MDNYIAGPSLSERAMSSFPLSIGTGLAFESLFSAIQDRYDPSRKIPNHIDVKSYQTCWINLTTLFRNMAASIEKEQFAKCKAAELAAEIETEIEVIQMLFENEGGNQCKPEFYHSTYQQLRRQNTPGLSLREPTTPNQLYYAALLSETLTILEKRSDTYHRFNDAIETKRREHALAITHYPYDLVGFDKFERLDLLESNTGVLKPRSRWNSKYSPMSGKSFDHLPFYRKLLLIFGDKVLIKPTPSSLRSVVLETSIARKWLPTTTIAKVDFDLQLDIKDPYALAVYRGL